MSKVFFDVGLSLDGYMAGLHRGPNNPLGDGGLAIHDWVFRTACFLERHGLQGGENSPENEIVKKVFERTGACIMGMRMFEEGEVNWPENAPFRVPVYVLTHSKRAPWLREGGTTFHFVTDGLDSARRQAIAAAQGKDIRICGGVETIQRFIKAGLVDEFILHISPMLLGDGLRLFDRLVPEELKAKVVGVSASARATHIRYQVLSGVSYRASQK